ncbi:alpha/beta fold hydrolase [Ruania zhangjianzhongii]|uniref:alpha/beta fold hydrolase n=1 Tax=Ruania zhangjianzhongii TaxID=2603206 RepID=UPI0011CBA7C8|nr:alpha/beta hydrolase [Ruania zhangjianzhongii]
MPVFWSGGAPIYYETHGRGRPLVLIHAISAGAGMWSAQVERFSQDHRVIVFDARGVGRSGPISGWWQVRDQIADDIAQLLTHLAEEQAAVCGVSFGGVIAQHFAARHPERVQRLIVVDAYSDTRPTSVGKALWLASVYAGSISNLLPPAALARLMRDQYRRWPHAADYLAEAVTRLRPLDALKTRCAINLVNYPPALNAANYPILGVVGENSWPRSLTFMEELRRAVPRTHLIRVPDSNDPTPLCQPEAFNAILADFLNDQ